jgi:hypothetical protein
MKALINYFKKYPYALVLILIMIVWMTINAIEADKYTKLLQKEGKFTFLVLKLPAEPHLLALCVAWTRVY